MEFLYLLLGTVLSFIFLFILFFPMERVFPANQGQPFFRKGWTLDLCYFLGQYLLWGSVVYIVLSYFSSWLTGIVPESLRAWISLQPLWLQAIEVVVLSDFLIYWGHRLQHSIPFLWRFHKVHHSAERLDWLAAHREHPLDSIYTIGLINLPMLIVGFPMEILAGVIAFRGIWAIYIHSNVRLSIGPLKKIIGSPELHHWHHHLDRDAGNYANISPLMDILFSTYVCPDHEPEAVGIKEEFPKNYVGQMVEPIVGRSTWKRILEKIKK
jgi:sterol desaturase/sphingolipid hydroxylase (fatty acid hydroxylase superfamily)